MLYKPRDPDVYIFEGASWKTAFVGGSYEFLANGARMLDHRALMHYVGTGITPAMTHAAPGIGSQYAYTVDDANGDTLDGAKPYTLTLPAPIPVKTFWAIDIYDTQTRSLLQTDNPYRASTTASATSTPRPTATSSSTSDPNPPLIPRPTGCAPSPERAGSPSCACTDPSKPGSTRRGNQARSNLCGPSGHDVPTVRAGAASSWKVRSTRCAGRRSPGRSPAAGSRTCLRRSCGSNLGGLDSLRAVAECR